MRFLVFWGNFLIYILSFMKVRFGINSEFLGDSFSKDTRELRYL